MIPQPKYNIGDVVTTQEEIDDPWTGKTMGFEVRERRYQENIRGSFGWQYQIKNGFKWYLEHELFKFENHEDHKESDKGGD